FVGGLGHPQKTPTKYCQQDYRITAHAKSSSERLHGDKTVLHVPSTCLSVVCNQIVRNNNENRVGFWGGLIHHARLRSENHRLWDCLLYSILQPMTRQPSSIRFEHLLFFFLVFLQTRISVQHSGIGSLLPIACQQ